MNRLFLASISFCIYLVNSMAWAEYRAFLLNIEDLTSGKITPITSTLDPDQYIQYYPLPLNYRITMQNTWMCWERSDHYQEICSPPEKAESQSQLDPTSDKARSKASTP